MIAAIRAGIVYCLAVFALGSVLGTIRTLALVPRLGETAAVALELPVMLVASRFICRAILRRIKVPSHLASRTLMGATAFALLIAAELALGLVLGGTLATFQAGLASRGGTLGLAGQLLFALIPLLQRRMP